MRHRRVFCQGTDGRDVSDSDCPLGEKPASSDICDMGSCSANTWFFTEWTGQVNNFAKLVFIIYSIELLLWKLSVRRNVERASRHAKLIALATSQKIATRPGNQKQQERAFLPKIVVASGSLDLGVR